MHKISFSYSYQQVIRLLYYFIKSCFNGLIFQLNNKILHKFHEENQGKYSRKLRIIKTNKSNANKKFAPKIAFL